MICWKEPLCQCRICKNNDWDFHYLVSQTFESEFVRSFIFMTFQNIFTWHCYLWLARYGYKSISGCSHIEFCHLVEANDDFWSFLSLVYCKSSPACKILSFLILWLYLNFKLWHFILAAGTWFLFLSTLEPSWLALTSLPSYLYHYYSMLNSCEFIISY